MEQSDIDENLKGLNAALFEESLVVPDTLYIELRLLRDTLFGTIFTFLLEDEDRARASARFEYIKDRMPEWITRIYDDPGHYFPEIGITTDQILGRMHDPDYHAKIYHASPLSEFAWVLANHLQLNANHANVANHMNKRSKHDDVLLTVNTYPLILSAPAQKSLAAFMALQYGVTTRVVSIAPENLSAKFIKDHQELYFCHVADLTKNEGVRVAFGDTEFLQTRIFAGRLHGARMPAKPDTGLANRELEITEGSFGILSDFRYIPSNLIFPARDRKPKA